MAPYFSPELAVKGVGGDECVDEPGLCFVSLFPELTCYLVKGIGV
jgi:hypothetical protein